MNSEEFRKAAHSAIDESKFRLNTKQQCLPAHHGLVIDYFDSVQDRRVVSNVEPGYLRELLPSGPPVEGEKWGNIQKDIEAKIMPGLTHWYFILSFLGHWIPNAQAEQVQGNPRISWPGSHPM